MGISSRNFGQWRFFWGMVLFASASCLGAETWMPDTRHLQAFEQGETCSIYSTLQGRAQLKLTEVVSERDQYDTQLRRRRALLEACAKEVGVVSFVSDKDEAQLAQLCSQDYSAWMQLGFRMRVVREDIRAVKANLKWLSGRISQCAPVPKPARRVAALEPLSEIRGTTLTDSAPVTAEDSATSSMPPPSFQGAVASPEPTQVPTAPAAQPIAPTPTVSHAAPVGTFTASRRIIPE